MDKSESKLLPCPFCGGTAEFDHDDNGYYWINCIVCGASTDTARHSQDDCRVMLAAIWNNRAPTSADSAQEREAFERWCRSRGYNSLMRDKHGDYSHGVIQWRWDTWQARAALAAPKQPMSALTALQALVDCISETRGKDATDALHAARAVLAAAQGEKK